MVYEHKRVEGWSVMTFKLEMALDDHAGTQD